MSSTREQWETLRKELNTLVNKIPNSMSGDGSSFAATLKRLLRELIRNVAMMQELDSSDGAKTQVENLTLTEEAESSTSVRIAVAFTYDGIVDYKETQIWCKTGESSSYQQLGTTAGGYYTIHSVSPGTTYTVKVIAVNKQGGTADFDNAPVASITVNGPSYLQSKPEQLTLTLYTQGLLWSWAYNDATIYTDYFELRTDNNPGVDDYHLIDRTYDLSSRKLPVDEDGTVMREGTVYLYVRNIFGQYSAPLEENFEIEKPARPAAPTLVPTYYGVQIYMETLPSGATGYKIRVNGTDTYITKETPWVTFRGDEEDISIEYCFTDVAGEGAWSEAVNAATVGRTIVGEAEDGQHVKFKEAWSAIPAVLLSVKAMQIQSADTNMDNGENSGTTEYGDASAEIVCKATDISTEGFYVRCYTRVAGTDTVIAKGTASFICTSINRELYTVEEGGGEDSAD